MVIKALKIFSTCSAGSPTPVANRNQDVRLLCLLRPDGKFAWSGPARTRQSCKALMKDGSQMAGL